jgi:hypothetical protein
MKKIFAALFFVMAAGSVHAEHTILFGNANSLTTGTVNNALLSNSSITKMGNNFVYYPRGTYSLSSPIEVPYGMTYFFQDGSTLTNAGNNSVLSVSGTVRGDPTILPNNWGPNAGNLLRVNTSGYVDSIAIRGGAITGDAGVTDDAPILLTGKNSHIGRLTYQETSLSGAAGAKRLVMFSGAEDSGVHGGRIDDAQGGAVLFQIGSSTNCIIENMEVTGSSLNYILRPLSNSRASFGLTIRNCRFVETTAGDGGGMIATGFSKNMQIIGNRFVKKGSIGDVGLAFATDGISSGTLVIGNFFDGFTTAISVQSGSHNTFIHGNQISNCTNGISDSGSNTRNRDNMVNGILAADTAN